MDPLYRYAIPALWMTWGAYWMVSAWSVKTTARQESYASLAAHVVPMFVTFVLVFSPRILPWGLLGERMYPDGEIIHWVAVAIVAAGLAFATWARIHLGRNWSGVVMVKTDHELIRSGPYGLVRHPIYTGLLVAVAGTAIARGEWRGPLGTLILLIALWRKLQNEERMMGETFGDQYAKYKAEVAALIPFVL